MVRQRHTRIAVLLHTCTWSSTIVSCSLREYSGWGLCKAPESAFQVSAWQPIECDLGVTVTLAACSILVLGLLGPAEGSPGDNCNNAQWSSGFFLLGSCLAKMPCSCRHERLFCLVKTPYLHIRQASNWRDSLMVGQRRLKPTTLSPQPRKQPTQARRIALPLSPSGNYPYHISAIVRR
ncbi:hypothetical protein VTK56DRAFT_1587 [Thermocarpiscus australiensis]